MPKALCEKPFREKDDPAGGCHNVIAAEEFCLVDKKGNVRAVLGLNDEDEPCLLFLDENENHRISVYVDDGQPGIDLADPNEHVRATLGLDDDSRPSLLFLDKEEKVHASLMLLEDEGPGSDFFDENEVLRASLTLLKMDDMPSLALVDKEGRRRKASCIGNDGEVQPLLVLYNRDGEAIDILGGECEEGPA